ncbi:MAG: sigma-54 interaction domain-containing protein, partial [Granulosicoccaceae bacterium]
NYDQGIVRGPQSSLNQTCDLMARIAPFNVNVLISGESGTGKELAARALHYNSLRRDQPFVAENCGALPDELLETELFGHKKGAYTGAIEDRIGLFAAASGGTIFLDEIGDTSLSFQVKLLRVLQEGEIRPMGTNRRQPIDVRVIAATNRNLEEEVRAGRFREDLFYRLAQFSIEMPTLRSRPEDIAPLAIHLLEETSRALGKRVDGFSDEAISCLKGYHWPGNVRELRNEIQRMLVFANGDTLGAELISSQVLYATPLEAEPEMDLMNGIEGTLKERVEALESRLLRETLIRNRWNKSRAAEELGLSRVGLRSKLERYGLDNNANGDTQGSVT